MKSFYVVVISIFLNFTHPVVFGATVSWVNWTSAPLGNSSSASGTITSSTLGNITVSYTGEIRSPTQVSGGINYWIPSTPYISAEVENPPPTSDIIALTGGNVTVNTITFSEPVVNPVIAVVSLGQANIATTYQFDAPFDIVSSGPGYWGNGPLTKLPGNVLRGQEGHGVIQFLGSYTSISWTVPTYENYSGFTIGVPEKVKLLATDAELVAKKNGDKVDLTLTTTNERDTATLSILRAEKLNDGRTAITQVCHFASGGSPYACTDNLGGDYYLLLETEYKSGSFFIYDEQVVPK